MTPLLKRSMLRLDKRRDKNFLSRRNSAIVFPGKDINRGMLTNVKCCRKQHRENYVKSYCSQTVKL